MALILKQQFYPCLMYVQGILTEGGRLSTVDLLALTSLDQLLLTQQILFFYKTSYLNEEVNCTEPSPSVSVPWFVDEEAAKGAPLG
jgi:hypothetical protein